MTVILVKAKCVVNIMDETDNSLDAVLAKIAQADDFEISQIIQAVVRRYRQVFPDWQVVFLSLPGTDQKARNKQLRETLMFLMNHQELDPP